MTTNQSPEEWSTPNSQNGVYIKQTLENGEVQHIFYNESTIVA